MVLILSRRKGEVIICAGGIEFHILEIKRSSVTVGIVAPDHVTIDRQEVAFRKSRPPPATGEPQ